MCNLHNNTEKPDNKLNRLVSLAADESMRSTVAYKHGAVIYQGKKKICSGYNQNTRSVYRKNISCSIHAEMDTLVRFLNSFIKIHNTKHNPHKTRRKMHKYSICVVRTVERIDGSIDYLNSLPCRDCLIKLKMVGLNKVSYTATNNQILTAKINRIETNHLQFCGVMRIQGIQEKMRTKHLLI